MSQPLTAEEEARYTDIIDNILAKADLTTVTRKKIRAGLEDALGGKDLSEQKNAIKSLIEERFDHVTDVPQDDAADDVKTEGSPAESPAQANGYSDDDAAAPPARKKQKREESVEDADARLAAQLQAQENNRGRTRATRGGSVVKKKKAPRKKSSKKVTDDDAEEGDGAAPKRKAGGGFQKPFNLSQPLSQLVGETQLSRPQVVKKLWEHIKSNELQDPSDKRQIRCDEPMREVFKQAKVDMFQMNKFIGSHLYPVEDEQ